MMCRNPKQLGIAQIGIVQGIYCYSMRFTPQNVMMQDCSPYEQNANALDVFTMFRSKAIFKNGDFRLSRIIFCPMDRGI